MITSLSGVARKFFQGNKNFGVCETEVSHQLGPGATLADLKGAMPPKIPKVTSK